MLILIIKVILDLKYLINISGSEYCSNTFLNNFYILYFIGVFLKQL